MAEDHEARGALTNEAFRAAVGAAPDGIFLVDETQTIVFANPAVERMFGYAQGELLGSSVQQLVPPELREAHAAHTDRYAQNPRARMMGSGLELRGRRRSGEEFPLEISLSPLSDDGRSLVIAIVRDIRERREFEAQLDKVRAGLILVDERERIARDLHDTVIQRLFAVGLALQAALMRTDAGAAAERMGQAIDDIDETIRDLRSAIFALQSRRPGGASVRDDVLTLAHEATRALGFEPNVSFSGPVDSAATDEIKEQLVATLRESLSNVAKHAHASSVVIDVSMAAGHIVLRVDDDGVGIDESTLDRAGNGLTNMRARADELGGSWSVRPNHPRGTTVEWHVPVGGHASGA
jgi:two-component system sensor histidine kinase DevS